MPINPRRMAERLHDGLRANPPEVLFELLYLFYVALIALETFHITTMSTVELPNTLLSFVLITEILAVGAKIAVEKPWRWWELLLAVFLCGACAWTNNRLNYNRNFLLELAVLIIGARGVSFEKILKVYLGVLLPALLITVILALTGQIENLIYVREGRERIAFGICYPTDFCAHLFFLICCYVWLRERRLRYFEIAVIVVFAWFCFRFCDARNTTLCLLILAAGLLYIKLRRRFAEKKGGEYRMNRVVSGILCASMPLAALIMFVLTLVYSENVPWLVTLDRLFSGRLALGRAGFDQYAISWSGQHVYMRGNGSALTYDSEYFWLDCSYVNILLRYGMLILIAVFAIVWIGCLRQRRNRSWERLGILAVIAVHCMIEHHLVEIAYDPFLMMAFAVTSTNPQRAKLSDSFRLLRAWLIPSDRRRQTAPKLWGKFVSQINRLKKRPKK